MWFNQCCDPKFVFFCHFSFLRIFSLKKCDVFKYLFKLTNLSRHVVNWSNSLNHWIHQRHHYCCYYLHFRLPHFHFVVDLRHLGSFAEFDCQVVGRGNLRSSLNVQDYDFLDFQEDHLDMGTVRIGVEEEGRCGVVGIDLRIFNQKIFL